MTGAANTDIARADIVRALFAAYLRNDRGAVEQVFTDDFTFTSPFDDRIDRATYFERCWRVSDWIAQHDLEHVLIDGDIGWATYRCVATDGRSFRNTEVFGFDEPVGANAIEVHVTRLRAKLAPDGPLVRTVRGVGYLLDARRP